ncbi:hypothetical protein Tco_0459574 [Tanacetum coccineum]
MKRQKGAGESLSKKDKASADSSNFKRFVDADEPRQEQEEEDHHDAFTGKHAHWFKGTRASNRVDSNVCKKYEELPKQGQDH